jgi:hypothetical protein
MWKKDPDNKDKTEINVEWFKDPKRVLPILKEKPPQTRKTNLASIIVLLNGDAPDEYTKMMNKDADMTAEQYQKQEKTEKQKENWIDHKEIMELWQDKYTKIKPLLNTTGTLSPKEMRELVSFMVQTVTGGIMFSPRRSEWIYMKTRNYDEKTDNYIDMKKSSFIFQKYKTAKTHGTEIIKFPRAFKALLLKYLKQTDNDYLIFNGKGEPMSNVILTQTLNSIYGKKISTSMLRHIYLSDKFADMPSLKELNETAQSMGHTTSQMMEYIVK